MSEPEDDKLFSTVRASLENERRLIAAGKLQRWDLTKWVVTTNSALAAASYFNAADFGTAFAAIMDRARGRKTRKGFSLICLYLVMVLSPSLQNIIIALSITSWVGSCRLVRGLSLSIREQEYITAALGIPSWRIVLFHVLPQAAPLLIWSFASGIPVACLRRSFIKLPGHGRPPTCPQQTLGESGSYFQYWPHMLFFPAIFIMLSVLAFQGMADGLRQAVAVNVNV